jgi:tetratricopeptide (TPR) repeat protein
VLLRVVEQQSDDLRVVLRAGFLFFEARDYENAAAQFERVLAGNRDQHEVAYFAGVSYRRQKERDRALELFEGIPVESERYTEARTQIASVREEQGDYVGALAYVEEARAVQSTRPLDLYAASLRAKAGDFEGAVAFLDGLLRESPEDIELLYNLGVLHGDADQDERAMEYMNDVLEREPDHAGALNFVGYTWAEQGTNLVLAEEYITRALEKRPEDGFITDSLGWLYYQKALPLIEGGQREDGLRLLERAKRELERAAELTGGDPVIAEHLGDVLLLMGDRESALVYYQEAIDLVPREREQPELRGKHERLRKELGRP